MLCQILASFLDLVGIASLGILGALAINGIESKPAGNRVQFILVFLHLQNSSFQVQAAALGLSAATVLVLRTVFSIYFTKRSLFFLSRRGAVISKTLISKMLRLSLYEIQKMNTQEIVYAVTTGVTIITLGIIGVIISLIADFSLLLVLSVGLFIVDPFVASLSVSFFSVIAFFLYVNLSSKSKYLGNLNVQLSVDGNSKILEVLTSYRESFVKNRQAFYSDRIGKIRYELAEVSAELSFLPSLSKYIVETMIVIGALGLAAVQFLTKDATHAAAALGIFLASGTRIAPAVMRIQQNLIFLKGNLASAGPTLQLIELLSGTSEDTADISKFENVHSGFYSEVKLDCVSVSFIENSELILKSISCTFKAGEVVGIIGASGAGKTTLADVILGVLHPNSGTIRLSGLPPIEAIRRWPGAISYVPQDCLVIEGSIRENVLLGFGREECSDSNVWEALAIAQLANFVKHLPEGLDTKVGERGQNLSGGQRQRLGIARAMLSKPLLLVLDEATSALDNETERAFTESLKLLKGTTTVLIIAHRLSTIRDADSIIYLKNGEILAQGTIEDIIKTVPEFTVQSSIFGNLK